MRHVGDRLLDGESARWRWPEERRGEMIYCGWVNAKNSYGAYTGFAPYMVIGGRGSGPNSDGKFAVVDVTLGSGRDADIVAKMCAEHGYSVSAPPQE